MVFPWPCSATVRHGHRGMGYVGATGLGRQGVRNSARTLKPPGRAEAFSDGVFTIAITLLVLELAVPAVRNGSLLPGLAHLWPSYLAYVISFFSIGTLWISHYGITRSLRGVDEFFLRINLVLLFLIAFLPYPTKLVAEFLRESGPERAAVTLYALTFLAISVCMRLAWRYASHERRLLTDDVSSDDIATRNTTLTPVLAFYAIAVAFGILLPQVTVALIASAVIFLAIPGPVLYRLRQRRKEV